MFLSYHHPTGHYEQSGVEFKADSTFGLGAYWEPRFNKRVGLDLGLRYVEYTINASNSGVTVEFGKVGAFTIPLGLNVHVTTGRAVDCYVGPFVHYTKWGNLRTQFGEASTDSEFGYGGALGLDARFGSSNWTFSSAVRYMQLKVGDSSLKIDVNPLLVDVGVGYRW